jgi:hypothetical protein
LYVFARSEHNVNRSPISIINLYDGSLRFLDGTLTAILFAREAKRAFASSSTQAHVPWMSALPAESGHAVQRACPLWVMGGHGTAQSRCPLDQFLNAFHVKWHLLTLNKAAPRRRSV